MLSYRMIYMIWALSYECYNIGLYIFNTELLSKTSMCSPCAFHFLSVAIQGSFKKEHASIRKG